MSTAQEVRQFAADRPPSSVRAAIQNFDGGDQFKVVPPSSAERSIIFLWGVRLEFHMGERTHVGWLCLADDTCRGLRQPLVLSQGKTSRATKHLRTAHGIVATKTASEAEKREQQRMEIDRLRESNLYKSNPRRFNLLLETLRIVNNNLPLRTAEYAESRLQEALVVKEEARVVINAKLVTHSVIELYATTKNEITTYIADNRMANCKNLVMMTDFWTCKTSKAKYLGLRVYFVSRDWELKSVLLATRRFLPSFGERDAGIRMPFLTWVTRILEDFHLDASMFFAATSDAGSDVKGLLTDTLGLEWEWCIAHMAHAATKAACGLETDMSTTNNPGVTQLIMRMKRTIYQVRTVEKMGDLFVQLCATKTSTRTTQLLNYDSSRFLSATASIRRILDKWDALVLWYQARREQAQRQRLAPPVFPLANDKTDLIQLLSLLDPVARLLRLSQQDGAMQVEVLMKLYHLRLYTLRVGENLPDYRSTTLVPRWIQECELTELVSATRVRLRDAFDDRFFSRYTNENKMQHASFLFELQQRLHPRFKNPQRSLHRVIRACCREKGLSASTAQHRIQQITEILTVKLRELLQAVAGTPSSTEDQVTVSEPDLDEFSDELSVFVDARPPPQTETNLVTHSLNGELMRWGNDNSQLMQLGVPPVYESILDYWKRKEERGEYQYLPKVARMLFSVPSTSAQIERDLSVSGMMVTTQRTSLSAKNVDMAAFLNRNREFVDLAQCDEIPRQDAHRHVPPEVNFSVQAAESTADFLDDLDAMITDGLVSVSIDQSEYGEEEAQ